MRAIRRIVTAAHWNLPGVGTDYAYVAAFYRRLVGSVGSADYVDERKLAALVDAISGELGL